MASRKPHAPWPLHLDPLWNDAEYRCLDFEGRGLIAAIIQAFWLSNLPPVPDAGDDEGWAAFAGCRVSLWIDRKADLLPIWERYEPTLRGAYARRKAWRETQGEFARRATAAATAARQARKLAKDQAERAQPTATPQVWKPQGASQAAVGDPAKVWKD